MMSKFCVPSKFARHATLVYSSVMSIEDAKEMSLRERKKLATRSALSQAALRLAVERGLENVRVEEIAAEAGVSPRTFNNYFSSKEEAIVAHGVDRAARVRAALRARPAGEPPWEAVSYAIAEQFSDERELDRAWATQARLVRDTPALVGEQLKFYASIERLLAEGIAERTGTDAECDLYPRLAAGVVISSVRVAFDYWLECESSAPFVSVLRRALCQVAEGLLPPNGTDRPSSEITGGNRAQLRHTHEE